MLRETDEQQLPLVGVADNDFAWLLLGVYLVIYRDGEWVVEDGLCFLERNAVFLESV